MMDRAGGRKMILSLVVLATGLAVDLTVGLSVNMLKLMMMSLGAFMIGNVGEHCFLAFRKRRTTASTQAINQVNDVKSELDTIRQDVRGCAASNKTILGTLNELVNKKSESGVPKDLNTQLQALNNQAALVSKGTSTLLGKVNQVLQIASGAR